MNITLTLTHISQKYDLSYGSVRTRAAKLFGRTSGYFTEDQIQQIVQNIKPRVKRNEAPEDKSKNPGGASFQNTSDFTNRNKIDQLLQRYNTLPLDDRLNIINTLMESSELKNRVNVLETELSRRWEIEDAYTRRNIENMLPEVTDYGF